MPEDRLYDPRWVADYFDAYGIGEWNRLLRTPTDEVRLAVHAHYLREHVRPGDRVLEIGAGAGRFTQVLVDLGARVLVGDISQVQLDLNHEHAHRYGFAHGVEAWQRLDVCGMADLASEFVDAVVCYGGPLSYVFDQRDAALTEMRRVLRPEGTLLLSVMSLWGSIHEHLPAVLETPRDTNRQIIATGDLHPGASDFTSHRCHLFRPAELRTLLERHRWQEIELSASNVLSAVWRDRLAELRQDATRWEELIRMEIEASRDPACHGLGTHLIAIATRPLPYGEAV
ncbi:MAG: class I SAM-dependent methyltransferase [Fimbriimonas sp.]